MILHISTHRLVNMNYATFWSGGPACILRGMWMEIVCMWHSHWYKAGGQGMFNPMAWDWWKTAMARAAWPQILSLVCIMIYNWSKRVPWDKCGTGLWNQQISVGFTEWLQTNHNHTLCREAWDIHVTTPDYDSKSCICLLIDFLCMHFYPFCCANS